MQLCIPIVAVDHPGRSLLGDVGRSGSAWSSWILGSS